MPLLREGYFGGTCRAGRSTHGRKEQMACQYKEPNKLYTAKRISGGIIQLNRREHNE